MKRPDCIKCNKKMQRLGTHKSLSGDLYNRKYRFNPIGWICLDCKYILLEVLANNISDNAHT